MIYDQYAYVRCEIMYEYVPPKKKNNHLRKATNKMTKNPLLGDILYIFMGVILAFTIYTGLKFALMTDEPLVTVVSGSMIPTYEIGDMLFLQGVNSSEIEKGDVVVYYYPKMDKLIIHRVYEMYDDGSFRTKGDNIITNTRADNWVVQPEWVVGSPILRIPYLGYPKIMLEKGLGYVF